MVHKSFNVNRIYPKFFLISYKFTKCTNMFALYYFSKYENLKTNFEESCVCVCVCVCGGGVWVSLSLSLSLSVCVCVCVCVCVIT